MAECEHRWVTSMGGTPVCAKCGGQIVQEDLPMNPEPYFPRPGQAQIQEQHGDEIPGAIPWR